jgi:hypothetical protein
VAPANSAAAGSRTIFDMGLLLAGSVWPGRAYCMRLGHK